MKYILAFFASVTLIFVFAFWILFTQSGNNTIKPYLQEMLQEKLQKDVYIEAFTLKTNFLDAEINIGETSKIIINGTFNIFKSSFDLEYFVDSKNLQTAYININEALNIKGKVVGTKKEFQANGQGQAFRSNISFVVGVKDEKPQTIKLNAKNVKIEDVLALLKKPIYSKGVFDVNVDAQSIGENNYKGDATVRIHYGTFDNALLKNDFSVQLAQTLTYKGIIKANIDGDTVYATSDIFSNIAKIQSKKTKYELKNELFYSDYKIHIPNLTVFEKTLNTPIQGNIVIEGNVQKDKEDFSFDANSKTLGGSINAIVFNDTLKADFINLELVKLMEMFKQPKYTDGKLNLHVDMQDTKKDSREGTVSLDIKDASLHVKEIKDVKSKEIIKYNFTSSSEIQKNIATIKADLISDLLTLNINESELDIDSTNVTGKYFLRVTDLNKFYFITERKLKGSLDVEGKYSYIDGKAYVDGNSGFLGAVTQFNLKDNVLHVKSDELAITKVTDMLYYPRVFDSFANLSLDYNLSNEEGTFEMNALNGRLLQSELTNLVLLISRFDLTQEVYKDTILRAQIKKKKIDYSLLMNGLESYVKIPKGFVDLESNVIDSDFEVQVKNKIFKGGINGTLDKPEVSLDNSDYIKHKIDKAIDKNIPEKWREPAKELLKLFG